jgi:hypothetical protein
MSYPLSRPSRTDVLTALLAALALVIILVVAVAHLDPGVSSTKPVFAYEARRRNSVKCPCEVISLAILNCPGAETVGDTKPEPVPGLMYKTASANHTLALAGNGCRYCLVKPRGEVMLYYVSC